MDPSLQCFISASLSSYLCTVEFRFLTISFHSHLLSFPEKETPPRSYTTPVSHAFKSFDLGVCISPFNTHALSKSKAPHNQHPSMILSLYILCLLLYFIVS